MNLAQILKAPVLTEQSMRETAKGKYTFTVHQNASKVDIKMAIKALYGADVARVNVIKTHPKFKWGRGRRPLMKRKQEKRAIITLKEGQKLDFSKLNLKKS